MSVHIVSLVIENFKGIKAFSIEYMNKALTVIGGRNRQGKTTALEAIAFTLGGQKFAPTNIHREGSMANPWTRLVLSNGLIVERKGKNSTLKITDPEGRNGGQNLLSSFIHQFALDLPKFLNLTGKEKGKYLLQIIGVADDLAQLEKEENLAYDERHAHGQIANQKKSFAEELVTYADVPETPVSASELIHRQQEILARNGENQRKRQAVTHIKTDHENTSTVITEKKKSLADEEEKLSNLIRDIADKKKSLANKEEKLSNLTRDLATARKTAQELQDESTEAIEASLRKIEDTNIKVRANLDKAKAIEDAEEQSKHYDALTEKLENVRSKKAALLSDADLPLPDLSVKDGELIYNGQPWDCMSGSEQLRVATAIVRKLNPECGFVLLDKLEQMDLDTLKEFGEWLEAEGLQAIATRVSTGDECTIVIEDGTALAGTADHSKRDF